MIAAGVGGTSQGIGIHPVKHPVDDDLKSICDQIATMALSAAEWLQHDKATFYCASCMCVFRSRHRKEGEFLFFVNEPACDARPMGLEDILKISSGQIREIEVTPPAGIPPQRTGFRRVEYDPEVLGCAINDAINVYIRDVLIPRGVINIERWNNDGELVTLKHQVGKYWAQRWRVAWVKDVSEESEHE
jgi:hypothetical protein